MSIYFSAYRQLVPSYGSSVIVVGPEDFVIPCIAGTHSTNKHTRLLFRRVPVLSIIYSDFHRCQQREQEAHTNCSSGQFEMIPMIQWGQKDRDPVKPGHSRMALAHRARASVSRSTDSGRRSVHLRGGRFFAEPKFAVGPEDDRVGTLESAPEISNPEE